MKRTTNTPIAQETIPYIPSLTDLFSKIEAIRDDETTLQSAQDLEELEQTLQGLCAQVEATVVQERIQKTLDSEQMQSEGLKLIKNIPLKLRNQGVRKVQITTLLGIRICLFVAYYSGKPQNRGRKRKRGKGFYPGLLLLGIYDRCTPAFSSEIGQTVASAGSFEEARCCLSRRGIVLDVKTIRNIAYQYTQRVRTIQQADGVTYDADVAGRKVVISTDGGRVRIRANKRGPKTKKGRNRYSTEWKEPKILIIYIVNESGHRDKTFAPFIDGVIKGPAILFGMMQHYLEKLNIASADKVLFVADGAKWIWERAKKLMKSLGLKPGQYYELLDFYHAVEHIAKVASHRKGMNKKERKKWIAKQRKLLKSGNVDQVIETIQTFCRGRNSKKIKTELNYFKRHQERMNYHRMEQEGLPLGSGAIESAVRRVVNLRIKGPGIFWKKRNAEAILPLRAYYKAGRWNLLKQLSISPDIVLCN